MARSRRTYRRTTSQRAVGLFSSILPYPLQRVAETQLGSSLLLLGIPALIIAGVLQFNWENGTPFISFDRDRAAQLREVAHNELNKINSDTIQNLHNSAHEFWNGISGHDAYHPSISPQNYSPGTNIPYASNPPSNNRDWRTVNSSQPLPSSSGARNVSTQNYPTNSSMANGYVNSTNYPQAATNWQQSYPMQPTQQSQPYPPGQYWPTQTNSPTSAYSTNQGYPPRQEYTAVQSYPPSTNYQPSPSSYYLSSQPNNFQPPAPSNYQPPAPSNYQPAAPSNYQPPPPQPNYYYSTSQQVPLQGNRPSSTSWRQ